MIEFQTLKMKLEDILPLEEEAENEISKTNWDEILENFISSLELENGKTKLFSITFSNTDEYMFCTIAFVTVPEHHIARPDLKISVPENGIIE